MRSGFMVFVWAQFELQVGIMCASAPTLRVFFRRYLGGSQASNGDSQGTVPKKSITVVQDSTSGPVREDSDVQFVEKGESQELEDLGTSGTEDGTDGLSMASRVRERDLTRYSREEDAV
jgi:hypothetical protein